MTQNTSDKKLSYLFITSCEENNLKKVGACITLGVDVNTVSEDGKWSGLTIAAHKNYIKLLDLLLSQPAIDVNLATLENITNGAKKQTKSKWTPLMFAGAAGHHNIVKKLVQVSGINFNHKDGYGGPTQMRGREPEQ